MNVRIGVALSVLAFSIGGCGAGAGAAGEEALSEDGASLDVGGIVGVDGGGISAADTTPAAALDVPVILSIRPERGPVSGGTIAILTVARLNSAGTVSVGGEKAEILADLGGGRFTIRTPAGTAGDADIVAKHSSGAEGTATGAFTFHDPTEAGPKLSKVTPNKGPSAGGALLLAQGENFAKDALWFVGWRPVTKVVVLHKLAARITSPQLPPGKHAIATTNADGQSAVLDTAYESIDPNDLGPKPTLSGILPGATSTAGGTIITISGDNLAKGSTLVVGDVPVGSWQVVDGKSGQFTAPAHDPGLLDVIYSAPDGQVAVLASGLLYFIDPPVLYGADPTEGPLAGGESLLLHGAHLSPGATVMLGTKPCTAVKVDESGKSLTCTIPAATDPGPVDITAKNADGQLAFLPAAYTYLGAPKPPEISKIAPDTGSIEGGYLAVVGGKAIKPETQVYIGAQLAPAVAQSAEAVAVTVPKADKAGSVAVTLKTTGFPDAALTDGFTYTEQGPPKLLEVVPGTGPTTGGIVVLIKGENLRAGSQVLFGDKPAKTAYVTGPEGIAVLLPKGDAGAVDVILKTTGLDDVNLKAGFEYKKPGDDGPKQLIALGKVSPATGPTTGDHWAVLQGALLPVDAKVFFGGKLASEVVFISTNTLTARVPKADKAGPVDVTVQDPATLQEATLKAAYTYYDPKDAQSAAPKLSAIKPAIGPSIGGTMALLTGDGMQTGALVFVAGRPGGDVTVVSGKIASFRTPPGKPGAADVMLVNADGQHSELTSAFVYASGGKQTVALTGATPGQGTSAGGTEVNAKGKGFTPGLLLFIDGAPAPATLVGPTELKITTPPHAPGMSAFTVTTPDGWSATLDDAFNFILEAPFIATISPDFGPPDGGTKVAIAGQGFHPNAVVHFGDSAAKVVTGTNNLLTVIAPKAAKTAAHKVDVTVRNPDFLSDTHKLAFEYTTIVPGKEVAIAALVPDTSSTAGGNTSTVHGSGFGKGTTVIIGSKLAETTLVDGNTLSIVVPAGTKGAADVQVVVPGVGEAKRANAFFYYDPKSPWPAPLLTQVWPGVGPSTGGTIALLKVAPAPADAQVFVGGIKAKLLGADETGALVVRMPAHAVGVVAVSVMLNDGKASTLAGAFTFYEPDPNAKPPVVTQVLPTSGSSAGGQSIAVTGAGFVAPMVAFVGYRPATGTKVGSESHLSAVTPAHPAGLSDIAVTRNDGLSAVLSAAYGYVLPAPKPDTVFPTTGHSDGGTTVVISGSSFSANAKVLFGDKQASDVKIAASHVLTAVSPPSAKDDKVAITIVNSDGQKGSTAAVFSYFSGKHEHPAPAVAKLVPDRGPWQGGTVLVIYGSGFRPGAQVLFGGLPAQVHVVDSTLITVTTPAGSIGPTDVTVLNADGQGHTKGASFSWIAKSKPAPKLLGITPASGPETGGTAVILTGQNLSGSGMGFVGYRPLAAWTVLNSSIATGTTSLGDAGKQSVVFTAGDGQSTTLVSGFEYVGAPRIDSFEPTMGAAAGGTVITLAGKGFSHQAKVTLGGKDVASVKILSPFVAKVQTNAHPPGPAQLRIENPDGQANLAAQPFRFVLPPQIDKIFPQKGIAAGGTPIVIWGKDFLPGAKVTLDGKVANNIVVVSAEAITARTPAGTGGSHAKVQVDNPDGQSALSKGLFQWVDAKQIGPPPTITKLTPATGPTDGGTWGMLTGKGLQADAWAIFGTVPAETFAVNDEQTARFVTAPSPVTAVVDVIVVHPDGGYALLQKGFKYSDPATLPPPPKVVGIDPDFGPTKGGTSTTLLGSGLTTGSLVFFATNSAPTVTGGKSGGSLVASTPPHALGEVDVRVTSPDGRTSLRAAGYRYVPPPQLDSIDPTAGPAAGGTTVTLTGKHFAFDKDPKKRARVVFCKLFTATLDCAQVPAAQTDVVSSSKIVLTTPEQVPGLSDVAIINPDGQVAQKAKGFLFRPPPKILSVTPATGSTLGNEAISIGGEGFQGGVQVKIGGTSVNAIKSVDSGKIVVLSPKGAAGAASVTVINTDGGSHTLGGGFTYIAPPVVNNVFPGLGPEQGGTLVTIQGDGFVTGVKGSKVVFGNKEVPEKDVQIESTGIIKCKSPAGSGPVAIKIVNPDGQTAAKAGAFVYIPKIPAPEPSHLTPAFGATSGGFQVSVFGKGFLTGAAVRFGNAAIGYKYGTSTLVLNAGTLITTTAPAHAPGKFDQDRSKLRRPNRCAVASQVQRAAWRYANKRRPAHHGRGGRVRPVSQTRLSCLRVRSAWRPRRFSRRRASREDAATADGRRPASRGCCKTAS